MLFSNPLFQTIKNVRGNQRVSLYVEPLWSLPHSLFRPFLALYMTALGLGDIQISFITVTFASAIQLVWCLFSGAITDKLGRKRTMFIFDILSWSIPCAVWAMSQSYTYFLVATFLNSAAQVSNNTFNCIMVEGEDTDNLINVFTILNLQGLLAGFIAPLAGYFIDKYTIVPTMRVIMWVSFTSMTIKFFLYEKFGAESDLGRKIKKESKNKSIFKMTFDGFGDFVRAIRDKQLVLYVAFVTLFKGVFLINESFWPLFLTSHYGVDKMSLSGLVFVKTLFSLLVFLFVMPYIKARSMKVPLLGSILIQLIGIGSLLGGLIFSELPTLIPIVISAICEGISSASLTPLNDAMMAHTLSPSKRASFTSFIYSIVLLVSIPLGYIAGNFAQVNRAYVMALIFVLTIIMFVVAAVFISSFKEKDEGEFVGD